MRQVATLMALLLLMAAMVSCSQQSPASAELEGEPGFLILDEEATEANAAATGHRYLATMTGDDNVPPIPTDGFGVAKIRRNHASDEIHVRVLVRDLVDVTVSHLHPGLPGENGPPVLTVYAGPTITGPFNGKLVDSTFTAADLEGDLEGAEISDLIALIEADSIYINVHTLENPAGEIRGQVEPFAP